MAPDIYCLIAFQSIGTSLQSHDPNRRRKGPLSGAYYYAINKCLIASGTENPAGGGAVVLLLEREHPDL